MDMLLRLVDCRDLMAPWSSLRVGSALKSVLPGGFVQVRSVDPSDLDDLRALCRRSGDEVVSAQSCGRTYVILIQHRGCRVANARAARASRADGRVGEMVPPKLRPSALSPPAGS